MYKWFCALKTCVVWGSAVLYYLTTNSRLPTYKMSLWMSLSFLISFDLSIQFPSFSELFYSVVKVDNIYIPFYNHNGHPCFTVWKLINKAYIIPMSTLLTSRFYSNYGYIRDVWVFPGIFFFLHCLLSHCLLPPSALFLSHQIFWISISPRGLSAWTSILLHH